MANARPSKKSFNQANTAFNQAKKVTLYSALLLLFILLFFGGRQPVRQEYVSATAGTTVETELIDTSELPNASVGILTQLQYTQRALFKAEVLSAEGDVITQISQDFSSGTSQPERKVDVSDWPDTRGIKVRLTVASQSITAAPPEGITAAQVPVIFEVNFYRQQFNQQFLWPGFLACVGLHVLVRIAHHRTK